MAGGIGSRFWPMSRQMHPKQFLDILGTGRTLLQDTYDRFLEIVPRSNIFIVTNKLYAGLVFEQLPLLDEDQVLLEPSRRNTAPCIAYATEKIHLKNSEANIIVAPSDHLILNRSVFKSKVLSSFDFVSENDSILTLGIQPSRPDTGYGYIQFVSDKEDPTGKEFRKVKTFTEKPNLELAKSFLSSGDFLWNSGIFISSTSSMKKAMKRFLPEVDAIFADGLNMYYTVKEAEFIENAYAQCTNVSIDYGIMEKAENVFVLPSDFGWSDLGTWGSMYENSVKDHLGNAIIGKNIMLSQVEGCIINMPKDKLAVIHGIKDLIVVESDGILLICKREDEQEIRQLVTNVRVEKGEDFV